MRTVFTNEDTLLVLNGKRVSCYSITKVCLRWSHPFATEQEASDYIDSFTTEDEQEWLDSQPERLK